MRQVRIPVLVPWPPPLDPSLSTSGSYFVALLQPTLLAACPASSMENSPEPVPEWCKCGQCRTMPQEIEDKCCKERSCVSLSRRFQKLCLDTEYLQLSIRNAADIRNDCDDNSSTAFCKAAYRHFIIDKYGYLGKNERKVCPSYCVLAS